MTFLPLLALLVAVTTPWPSHAFISLAPHSVSRAIAINNKSNHAPVVTLLASKSAAAKKKNKKKTSSTKKGRGFGSTTNAVAATARNQRPKSKEDLIYPELEPQVVQTLVPSPYSYDDSDGEESGGALSEEMYDRLEEIYGLDKFNFGGDGAVYKYIGVLAGDDDDASNDWDKSKEDSSSNGSLFDDILKGGKESAAANQDEGSPLDVLLSPPTSTISASISPALDEMFVKSNPTAQRSSPLSTFDLNSIPPFQKFRVLHVDPMILAIDDFLTEEECDRYVQISTDSEQKNQQKEQPEAGEDHLKGTSDKRLLQPLLLGQSRTVGKDSRSKAQRTSTTWFHYYEGVPELMAKASRLLGLDSIGRWEEPQTVRYRKNERFTWHLDALSPEEAAKGAGQRVATLLVYLKDLSGEEGGATMFRDLGDGHGPLKV